MTTASIYSCASDIVYCSVNSPHGSANDTTAPPPQSQNVEELRALTARSRQVVMTAIAQYRAEEAEYKRLFHTERWWEKVPGFELLAIPRGLLYRLFRRSKNGLNYWLLQHEGMNGSSKIKESKLEHEYAVNLAAAALGQGFDEGQDQNFPQTERLIKAWWKLHAVQPQQPEIELLCVIGDALGLTKDRHRYTPELLAQHETTRNSRKAARRRSGRKRQAEAEGRAYKSKLSQPGKPGKTANQVAGWLVEKSRQAAESEDLFARAEERGWSVEQAVEELGLPRETIKKCLARLVVQFPEQVVRIGRGRYRFLG